MRVVSINSPNEVEARTWLNEFKEEKSLSWPQLAKLTDVAVSTLSLFSTGKYAGNNGAIAAKVLAFRDRRDAREASQALMPTVPSWFDTPTSERLTSLLRWAHSGEIVLIVTSPGIGKTRVAERFAENHPNVWLSTMSPSTNGVANLAVEVGLSLGLGELTGSPQQLSRQIKTMVQGRNGLLIIDEAQELSEKALNELRGWHDQTKVGIALLGNETVVGQIDSRKSAMAQISSRFSIRHVQVEPMQGDLDALLDAWDITESDQRAFLSRIGTLPGALREVTHTIKIASVAAFGAGQRLTIGHLRDAARQRNVKVGSL